MRISVAMCTYNGAAHLGEQLASIAAQTRPPDELLVCDDASRDSTHDLVRAFASEAPFPVRLHVNERNLGSTKNFEQAIRLCGGDVIVLSDQDDVWMTGKLARIESAFDESPDVGLVFTDAEVVDSELRPTGQSLWHLVGLDASQRERIRAGRALEVLLPGWHVTGATMAFRARFRKLLLPLPEDLDLIHDGWIAALLSAVAGVAPVKECLIRYRQHAGQQIGAPERKEDEGGLGAAIARANPYDEQRAITERLRGRLAEHPEFAPRPGARETLEGRITHLRARSEMPRRRIGRLPGVMRELLSGRYRRYSKGLSSAAKDLFAAGAPGPRRAAERRLGE